MQAFPPMMQPGFPMTPTPPLPPGWTEHTAPTGHLYYYNAAAGQSTYIRPLPQPGVMQTPEPPRKKKKEKPLVKTPIPNTVWIRVKTTEDNTFYHNKESKESVWELPEEIAEAVQQLEVEEEAQRVVAEAKKSAEAALKESTPPVKRKAGEAPVEKGKKKPKVVAEEEKDEDVDDKEWQRRVAEDMAAEEASKEAADAPAPEAEPTATESKKKKKPKKEKEPSPEITLSVEEGKAVFKALLQEKDINPLTPYDSAMPQLIQDPRYLMLRNVADRHAAFNEYCLEKTRAQRAAKASAAPTAEAPVDEKVKAREAYDVLLRDELTSTRTTWDEWRRKWKKDRRFFGFGKDDREREKVFKEWRNSLGERKRKEAQKAEAEFFALLREHEKEITEIAKSGGDPAWKDVKKNKAIYSDPRYDAVGSSSLREELYGTFLKARLNPNGQDSSAKPGESSTSRTDYDARKKLSKQERAERATREREEKVRKDMVQVERNIHRSIDQLSEKEGTEQFQTLLTDAIRDPTATYYDSEDVLRRSPIFSRCRLSTSQKTTLFNAHVNRLREKQLTSLYAVFEGYTPGLDAQFRDFPDSVYNSAPAQRLKLDKRGSEMRYLWEDWQSDRNVKARADFQQLLEENQFVGFWGSVKKSGKDGTFVPGVDAQDGDDENEEGEGGGGKADLKTLAKGIGKKQIEGVLKHDKRYRVFDHIPEERKKWIEDFLARMSAAKLSVHAPDKS